MNAEAFFCKFCQKPHDNPRSRARHESWCRANPDQSMRERRAARPPVAAFAVVSHEPREPDKPYKFKRLRGEADGPAYHLQTVPTKPELDEYEVKLLGILCRLGHSPSSVSLAADLYETTEEVQESRVLEWNLIELMLYDLNVKGLVRYRLGEGDLFVRIRPTAKAYAALKINVIWQVEVGHASRRAETSVLHPGDPTDYRSQPESAPGIGPCIHEDFIDHCAGLEPSHLAKHRRQLIELYGTDQL